MFSTTRKPTDVFITLIATILFSFFSYCRAEYILSIELNKFNNPNGLLVDGTKCPASTCLTYFKFCLMYNDNNNNKRNPTTTSGTADREECLSKFETDIIGANVIGEEQFQLTTNSIKFRLNSTWNRFEDDLDVINNNNIEDYDDQDRLYLLIQVLNYERVTKSPSQTPTTTTTTASRLISEWKLPIRFFKLNKWIRYENSVNYKLRQVFLFDYRLECADDYYGPKCEIRKFPCTFLNFLVCNMFVCYYLFNYL